MKRFVKVLFLVLLALPAIALLVANRHDVIICLDPFAGPTPEGTQITVQLFVFIGVAIMVGVIFGGVMTYLEQGKYRRAARRARREVVSLRAEVARLSLPRPGEKRKGPYPFQGTPAEDAGAGPRRQQKPRGHGISEPSPSIDAGKAGR